MRTFAICSIVVLFSMESLPAHAQNSPNQFNGGVNEPSQSTLGGLGQSQQTGRGTSEFGNPAGQGGLSQAGQRNRQQHQGLVGRDAEDVRENFRNLSGRERRRATFDVIVENLNEMRESRRRWRSQQRPTPQVRVQLRPAFSYSPPSSAAIRSGLQQRLDTLPVFDGTTAVRPQPATVRPKIEMNNRVATLRGTVSSEHQRALLARLVSLEPGVSSVENLLTVETP